MRYLDSTDYAIIDSAMELFIFNGITNTEMTVIADHAGISRRTLYRRFSSKDDIAFLVIEEMLKEFGSIKDMDQTYACKNGLDKLSMHIDKEIAYWQSNPEKLRLLIEFDLRFCNKYPVTETAQEYFNYNKSTSLSYSLKRAMIEEGIQDGSIRPDIDIDYAIRFLENSVFAMCERNISRESIIRSEHGYSIEFIFDLKNLILNSFRACSQNEMRTQWPTAYSTVSSADG